MDPVRLTDLVAATRAETAGLTDDSIAVSRVCIDSRQVEPGDAFWALRGKQQDGHNFTGEALRRGAVVSIVERNSKASTTGPRILVDDTGRALADFAHWYRNRLETLVIGVTGSVGKTTTREMLHAVLSAQHRGTRSPQNFNNEIGLPLSLLQLGAKDEFGVLELGAARIGDIRRLCGIASPEVGVITQIGKVHVQTFGSLADILKGKGELLESLPRHGFAVVAGDDDFMHPLAQRAVCPVIFVGERAGNQVRATDVSFEPGRLRFSVDNQQYELPAPARHYLTAALCALAVAREIGMTHEAIAAGFARFVGEPGRCTIERSADCTIIDDTYNASPLSMRAACLCLRDYSGDYPGQGHKLLVVGDMLELGNESSNCHQDLGAFAASVNIDRLLSFGDFAQYVSRGALAAGMRPQAVAECRELDVLLTVLDCWIEPGDVILVKGSRGMRMERVVQWLNKRGTDKRREQNIPTTARAVA
jgi:UDP-N-acetylmuramoyl-tripeptide--D-alanyl-D-alanine ligase